MPSKAVVDAVEARLGNPWNGIPVYSANTTTPTPSDGSAFLEVQYPVANEQHVGMAGVGNRRFRESGAFRIVLSIPTSQGLSEGLDKADQLRALFRAAQFSGVSCLSPNPPFVDNSNDNGNCFLLAIVVPYYFDLLA